MCPRFRGPAGWLEGEWHFPRSKGPFPCVVVCHPHPLYGGDMDNSVVVAVCEALAAGSIAAFRFNFRTVGGSEGSYDEGIGEQTDAKAALDFVSTAENIDPGRLGLAGYSFGGWIALTVARNDNRVKALGLVSPYLAPGDLPELKAYSLPKFVITGSADTLAPLPGLAPYLDSSQYAIIPSADHFWGGFENEVGKKIAQFFTKSLIETEK